MSPVSSRGAGEDSRARARRWGAVAAAIGFAAVLVLVINLALQPATAGTSLDRVLGGGPDDFTHTGWYLFGFHLTVWLACSVFAAGIAGRLMQSPVAAALIVFSVSIIAAAGLSLLVETSAWDRNPERDYWPDVLARFVGLVAFLGALAAIPIEIRTGIRRRRAP